MAFAKSLTFAAACFFLLSLAAGQAATSCVNAAAQLQAQCGALQGSISAERSMIGASDDDLRKAITSSSIKASPTCCKALQGFGSQGTKCPCDPSVVALAQTQGFTSDGLITLARVGAISCSFSGAPKQTDKCPASG